MIVTGAPGTAPDVSGAASWVTKGGIRSLERPLVMGILNLTPDSFSDAGELPSVTAAVERGLAMVEQGADLLDLGGESTRPGALPVEPGLQLQRVLPVLEALARHTSVPISIDTRSAAVARQALASGADVINDVSALGDPAMAGVVREARAGLVLMHMRGTPETMQSLTGYVDLVAEVRGELARALDRAIAAGIETERIVVDPGIGFAKTAEQNLLLLRSLEHLAVLGRPLLVGPSRKSFLGHIGGGIPPRERVAGTVAACVVALLRGARIFRVHDVAPVRQALDVAEAIHQAASGER